MGTHQIQVDRTPDLARVVGRGAMATSVALALAGTGAGFATASPTHGHGDDDGHGSEQGHGNQDGEGYSGYSSDRDDGYDVASTDCGPGDEAFVGGLLGDLGLSGSSSERCATDGADGGTSGTSASSGSTPSSTDTATDTATDTGARRAAAPSAPATAVNPDDVPPAPGETKVIDLPDTPQR